MAPPPPRDKSFQTRLLSALALLPPVVAAVYLGPPASDLLVVVAGLLLCWEWARLVGRALPAADALAMTAGVLAASVLTAAGRVEWALAALAAGFLASIALSRLLASPADLLAGRFPWAAAGTLYLGLPCAAIIWLRQRPADGLEVLIWLLLVVWAVDIFAYLVGRKVGGPKLWPAVSPKKTWSGLLGGTLAAVVVGGLGSLWLDGWSWPPLAVAAALLAVVAQGGDLLESAVKRRFGVKDASNLIPGHGGLLDRVDGLMTASLALAVTLWLAKL